MAEIWMERNPADEDCKLSLSIALKTKNQLETEQVDLYFFTQIHKPFVFFYIFYFVRFTEVNTLR